MLTVPAGVILALLLAVLFNRQIPGIGAFRTLTFIPVITSMVAVSLIWSMLYEDNGGLLNTLLGYVGLPPVHWLTDTNMAMISIAIMSIWKGLGYNMTIFLAGLQGVPHDLYEAATIDGANSVQKFFKITVPMIGPTTYFVTLMSLIGSLQVFDQVYIMTNGARSTRPRPLRCTFTSTASSSTKWAMRAPRRMCCSFWCLLFRSFKTAVPRTGRESSI